MNLDIRFFFVSWTGILTFLFFSIIKIERDHKIGTLSKESYDLQKTEILAALQRLDDKLSIDEKLFLQNNTTDSLREFSRIQQQETGMEKFSFRFVL